MSIKKLGMTLIHHFGYVGLMIALILEFICPVIPGETLMLFVGFQTWSHSMSFIQSVIFAVIGTNLGSFGAYFIGKYLGRNFLIKYGKYIFLTEPKLADAEKRFEKYQKILYLFSRFIAGVRHIVPYLGGIYKIDFRMFMLYNIAGSILWCLSFITAGHFIGSSWRKYSGVLHKYSIEVLILLVTALIAYKVIRAIYLKRKKNAE